MPKQRKTRTDDDLSRGGKHVAYEIAMLNHAAGKVTGMYSSPASYPTGLNMNMALESFLIHYRNLRAFLLPMKHHNTHPEDIIGSDFLGHTEERNYGDEAALMIDKDRLDQMLTHLTYHRDPYIDEDQHRWAVSEMFEVMVMQLRAYLMQLPVERQAWILEGLDKYPVARLTNSQSEMDALSPPGVYSTNVPAPRRLNQPEEA